MAALNNNPFGKPAAFNPFADINKNANSTQPRDNPFAKFNANAPSQQPALNPFASVQKPVSKSPFLPDAGTSSSAPAPNAFANATATFSSSKPLSRISDAANSAEPVSRGGPKSLGASAKRKNRQEELHKTKHTTFNPSAMKAKKTEAEHRAPSDFATKIYAQLARDGVKPPAWPKNPGAVEQKQAMADFRDAHRIYREKARKALMRAELIDDPDKRRRLDQALPFKGICEEMCPEWEKITRITEHDIWKPEGVEENGARKAIPQKMVKRLARSAAGQEAALPMDVRTPAACRRALDYLIDELIPSDDTLPANHKFIWDRSRSIRIDLSVQTPSMTPEEVKDEIYCLETIARFHATSAHLMSQIGFAREDFSAQQEVEQLSKTLMSLRQRYMDCADMGIVCENEAEFRAYYVLFFAWDTSLKETVESWGEEMAKSDVIQTALCMVEAMQNTTAKYGPLRPFAPTEITLNAASMFFSIVASPKISYTMACIAELHFNVVRRSILRVIIGAYSRPRDGPKDLTPDFLKRQLRLDTEEEAINFAEKVGLEFEEDNDRQYLLISPRQQLQEVNMPQTFSWEIVERKRNHRPLADVIHETVYGDPNEVVDTSVTGEDEDDSLFVQAPKNSPSTAPVYATMDSDLEDTETPATGFGPMIPNTPIASTGITPASSIFSRTESKPAGTGSTLGSNPFGGFSNLKPASSSFGTSEATTTEKKVTFGENSYKFIEPLAPKTTIAPEAISSPPSLFKVTNTNEGITSASVPFPTSNSSWLPPTLPGNTANAGNSDSQSVFSKPARSAEPGTSFPISGASPETTTAASSSSASSIFNPPSSTAGRADGASSSLATKPSPSLFPSTTLPIEKPTTPAPLATPPLSSTPATSAAPSAKSSPLFPPASNSIATSQLTAAPILPASALQSVHPELKIDPMENFTRWYVCGDHGFMQDHLQEWLVGHVLKDVWGNFREAEEERRKKEEDEKSWAEARKFRTYSLQVTYFYRWLDIFRKRRVVKRIQMEKEKARKWRLSESAAQREATTLNARAKTQREAVELLRRSAREKAEEKTLREFKRPQAPTVKVARQDDNVPDVARSDNAEVQDDAAEDQEDSRVSMLPSEMLFKQESRRRQKHGLGPLNRLGSSTTIYKEGSKVAKIRALSTSRDSLSMSTGSMRNSTFSSSYRSSLGFNGSRVGKPRASRVSDPYWRMKAHGLVQMPNGEYLHESLARPMLRDGKRYGSVGHFGLRSMASETPSPTANDLFDESPPLLLGKGGASRVSLSPSVASTTTYKRKRAPFQPEEDPDDEDLAAYRSERSASVRKRAKSGESPGADSDFLAQMESLLHDMESEGKNLGRPVDGEVSG